MLQAIQEIQTYTEGKSYTEFSENSMMMQATIRQLEVVEEAATQVSQERKVK